MHQSPQCACFVKVTACLRWWQSPGPLTGSSCVIKAPPLSCCAAITSFSELTFLRLPAFLRLFSCYWNDYFWPFDVAVRIVPSRVREVKISTSSMRSKLSPLSLLYFLSFSVSSFGWPQLLLLFSCSSYIHRDRIYFSFYPYPPPQPNVHLSLPPHSGFLSYSGCCWDLCPNPCCQVRHFSWPFWTHMGKRTGGFASIFIGWNIRILWKKIGLC